MIYLDNAATSLPKPKSVGRRMAWAAEHLASPGRGSAWPSRKAEELLYRLRQTAGEMFSCEAERVVLTSSATHGLNVAIKTLVGRGDRVVISCVEHNAVVRPLYALGADIQAAGERLFDDEGFLSNLEKLLTPDTKACVLTHVSNVFGWILPVEAAAELCRKRNIPFVLDVSQSAGVLPVSMRELGAAFIAMPGHKGLLGPAGTGLLLCGMEPKTLMEGGTGSLSLQAEMPDFLPDRLEAGTHNVSGAAGLLAGMEYVRSVGLCGLLRHEQMIRQTIAEGLREIPEVEAFSGREQTGVLSFRVAGQDTVELAERLARRGICLRTGLHCAPLAHKTAGTLETGTVRISPGVFNSRRDGEMLVRTIRRIV